MKNFIITQNDFLKKNIIAYYRYDYTTYGTEGNPDFITHLKNQFGDGNVSTLQNAVNELKEVIQKDLSTIKNLQSKTNLTVCVVPRAKAEGFYSDKQELFKSTISSVVDKLNGFTNGTNYIIRKINTRTTHMNRSGYGLDGDMPYVGITKATCKISNDVRGKDILLIDDIYTKGVNIDEDAIQALLDSGSKSVQFYGVAKSYKGKVVSLKPSHLETYLLLTEEHDLKSVALQRGLKVGTILDHLPEIKEILGGDGIAIERLQPPSSTIQKVRCAIQKIGGKDQLKPIFEELDKEISYDDIRLSLMFIN